MSNQSSQLNIQGKQTEIVSLRNELNSTKEEKDRLTTEI